MKLKYNISKVSVLKYLFFACFATLLFSNSSCNDEQLEQEISPCSLHYVYTDQNDWIKTQLAEFQTELIEGFDIEGHDLSFNNLEKYSIGNKPFYVISFTVTELATGNTGESDFLRHSFDCEGNQLESYAPGFENINDDLGYLFRSIDNSENAYYVDAFKL